MGSIRVLSILGVFLDYCISLIVRGLPIGFRPFRVFFDDAQRVLPQYRHELANRELKIDTTVT